MSDALKAENSRSFARQCVGWGKRCEPQHRESLDMEYPSLNSPGDLSGFRYSIACCSVENSYHALYRKSNTK